MNHLPDPSDPTDDGWDPIDNAGVVEAELRFWDPKSDMLILYTSSNATNPYMKNNTTIAVPRKNIADADNLPIKLPNGKTGTLKDVIGTSTQPKKSSIPDNFWGDGVYLPGSKKTGTKGILDDI